MTATPISNEAIEAAARALLDMDLGGGGAKLWRKWPKGGAFKTAYRSLARAALEAAAPHMLAPLLALADERDKTHGTIRGHITTRELRHALDTHDDTQGEK